MENKNCDALKEKIEALSVEHRDLDEVILDLVSKNSFDQISLQRLKKKKLHIKDQITKMQADIHPNIIA